MKKPIFKEITLMNAFLCFSVIMIHLTSSPLNSYAAGSIPHGIVFFINKFLCFAVPAFLFLSGFKLWGKYGGERIGIKDFIVGRLLKIVLPYLLSVGVYLLYFFVTSKKDWLVMSDIPEYFLLGTLAAHFYYVIIAVQLYLIFPLLNILVKRFPLPTFAVSLVSTVVFSGIVHFTYSDRFFGSYVFYFILGMFFAKYRPHECIRGFNTLCVAGFLATAAIHLGYLYMATLGKLTYVSEPLVNILYATFGIGAIYFIFTKLNDRLSPLHKFAKIIGGASYDIYLYHILGIFILQYDIYPRFSLSVTARFIISSVLIFGIAVTYSYIRVYLNKKFSHKKV